MAETPVGRHHYIVGDHDLETSFGNTPWLTHYSHLSSLEGSERMVGHTYEVAGYWAADYDPVMNKRGMDVPSNTEGGFDATSRYWSRAPDPQLLTELRQGNVEVIAQNGGIMAITRRTGDVWLTDPGLRGDHQLPFKTVFYADELLTENPPVVVTPTPFLEAVDSPRDFDRIAHFSQDRLGELSSTLDFLQRHNLVWDAGIGNLARVAGLGKHAVSISYLRAFMERQAKGPPPQHPIIQSFSRGFDGKRPSPDTIEAARTIVKAAEEKNLQRDIEVDDTDGALAFELRLTNGHLVIGELSLDGELHVDIFNDRHPDDDASIDDIWVNHLPQTTASDLVSLF